ncbi:MAG: sialidase family protein [Flavobacteriaceae bacterium]
MQKQFLTFISVGILLISINACKSKTVETVSFLAVPTGLNSSEPSLHKTNDGNIYLSWIENDKDTVSHLKFSTLKNNEWSPPKTITKGKGWFVNWADFPSITSFGESNLSAHYLEKSADDTYAYDVKLIQSTDNGETWNEAFKPHSDNTNTEHGFVSKVAIDKNSYLAIWLDGRQMAYAETDSTIAAQMTLRSAVFNKKGELIEEHLLDNRVCDCCQTDVAMTEEGPIVVYRNRSDDEMRDTYYVKHVNGSWTEPKPVFNDNWNITGCPVNGPAISAKDNIVAVTWFTIANNAPKVKVAFSNDNGNTFNAPITIAQETIMGRLDIELLDDGSAIVSSMDSKEGESVIILQHIRQDGNVSIPFIVSETANSRSSGFPRMVVKDDFVYMAWTSVGDYLEVKSAKILLDAIKE